MSGPFVLLLALFVGLSIARVPIAVAMIAGGFGYLWASGQDLGIATDQIMNSLMGSHVLLAVPMFIFAANVMNAAAISERLWSAAEAAIGGLRGGLGHVTVLSAVIFSSMSGSAIADAAGPGMVSMRMMRRVGGFRRGHAAALTAASATIAPIIPPSIPLVLYALYANASVGALFLAGLLPGALMALALMAVVWLRAEPGERVRPAGALGPAILPLTIPVVLLGGIWSGAFTPTEAAAVAAIYATLLAAFVLRTLSPRAFVAVLAESTRGASAVMLLIAGAFLVNYAVTAERLDRAVADLVLGADLSRLQFLLAVNLTLIALGCLIDTGTLILVLVPLLMPSVRSLGIDPVHFGVMATINIMIGLITPPFGLLLFTLSQLGEVPVAEIVREVWPFLAALLAVLALVTLVPWITLALPHLFGMG